MLLDMHSKLSRSVCRRLHMRAKRSKVARWRIGNGAEIVALSMSDVNALIVASRFRGWTRSSTSPHR